MKKKLEKGRTKGLIKASVNHEGDFSSTSFIEGFDCGILSTIEVLKDKRNKYNSWLSDETKRKLGKTVNIVRVATYKSYIQMIDELIKDLEL